MTNFTYNDFVKSYVKHSEDCPTYRYGQHFINLFIKDSSSHNFQIMWNAEGKDAVRLVNDYIFEMQWDCEDLPIIREDLI